VEIIPFSYYICVMSFEFDAAKSVSNLAKHGIDFTAAQAIWLDDLMVRISARTTDEPRYMVIGRIKTKHWSAICVDRGEKTRIISVRRSRKEEVAIYESL